MADSLVFTLGHSTHDIESFIDLLSKYDITCLIDVRSAPYSRIAPQFNKETLSSTLKDRNILYVHFEKEFGARHTKPSLLDEEGKVDFDKVRATAEFQQGIERLKKSLQLGYKVALMCSEANPFDCHRFSMISYQLAREGMQVRHILADGTVLENRALEEQLLQKYHKKLPQTTLFETVTPEMQLETAYRLRGKDVAFSASKASPDEEMRDAE
jgi:uncharacterized protein (DUF488 family)